MPTIEITDDHRERIESLRKELAATHAGAYASVDTEDTLAYLLDLADAVDDPERAASADALAGEPAADAAADPPTRDDGAPFDRDRARERLAARNRKHGDPDAADEMDLYSIAAAFDVSGRSDMTKSELIEAVLDAAATLAADPFSRVDVDLGDGEPDDEVTEDEADEDDANDEADDDDVSEDDATESEDEGASQLNAMMSLLDTHDDKWREADGDARYEVDLPDGNVETARTKDDVRALLFKNY
ncbi:Rho termination factor N-terminal domain-containing protein [Halorubrum sp. N11]|uniref:Rho termination factor N-terminal domain-containing protein n=1 Tax=Halorubrum sp. N11 TaxID=3402276 RepID=UPI003EBF6E37